MVGGIEGAARRTTGRAAAAMIAAAGSITAGSPAWAETPVAVELVLVIDASTSVDPWEYALQRVGLAGAFRDPGVIAAIDRAGAGGVAVSILEFAGADHQTVLVGWRRVDDPAGAETFADAIEAAPGRPLGGGTAIGSALAEAAQGLDANDFVGLRRVIDVSGDGASNQGVPIGAMRDAAVAAGITINGLAIGRDDAALERHYRDQVIGGTGAFLMVVEDHRDFAEAIRQKLIREIEGQPLARRAMPDRGPG